MRQIFPRSPIRAGLGWRITVALLASTAIVSGGGVLLPAAAQQAGITYSVPAGPLGSAITRFGEASGLQVLYPSDLVRGKQTPGVSGTYTPNEALARLLAGSGLTYRYTAANTVTLAEVVSPVPSSAPAAGSPEGAVVLDTVVVTAAAGTTTEGTNSWTTEWMRSATGMALTQKQTPQSTSAITDAQMKDRNITSIPGAMAAATGITAQIYDSERIDYHARGFAIDAYQIDGVPLPTQATVGYGDADPDMALYDHVEIVRGATGLLQGAGEPAASVNFIRKLPTDFFRGETASAIAYPLGARVEADVSGPLNEAGTVRGRLIGAVDNRQGSMDGYKKGKYIGYGALELDLDDSTLVSLGVSHQATRSDNVTWGGLPPFDSNGDLIDWPRGFNLGADWTYLDTDRTEAFASLEHVFDNGWTARLTATHMRTKGDIELAWIHGIPDAETGLGLTGWGSKQARTGRMSSLTGMVNGDFEAFGRVHQLTFGATGSTGHSTYQAFGLDPASIAPIGDVFDYHGGFPRPDFTSDVIVDMKGDATEFGIYGATQIQATDKLSVIAGTRVNWWKGKDVWDGVGQEYSYDAIVTPYLGFTYDITDVYTAYGSATTIYKPQPYQDADGNRLDPRFGYNYELGVKASWFDGGLYASAAVFQTDQHDVAEWVSSNPVTGVDIYRMIDGTTTRGFELEAAGAISDRWNASLGYTYRYSKDADGKELYTNQPRSSLKLATSYRVPGVLDDRLTVGGAMRWQSGTDSLVFVSETEQPSVRQDPYAVFDFSAKYDVNDETSLVLSVNNVLNKKYYSSTGFYDTVVYGDSRSAELVLRAKF